MNGAKADVLDSRHYFEQHSGEFYDSLFREVLKLTRNKRDAEDITQTAFMNFLQRMQRTDWKLESKSIRSYLSKAAKNLCRDMWRKGSKITTFSYDDDVVRETLEQQAVQTDDSVAQIENRIYFKELFQALPNVILQGITDYERRLFQLRKVEQLSLQEIAEIMERDVNQVRYDLQKIEARIRYRVAKITKAAANHQV